ncbi:carboxyl-terminal processing protease [Chitinophaga skermanii]|uniref:Carboxyl-terminal processing protease n=1 Tax=Chitinophaga skermanii TaxID=331697 RepID=A0A327R426_9BACT|nr:S41 family peptidase [Chitinophaga skermanii]RAJ10483.1 carboxyl-terminal processing protease [Chitinophaga skermanii]
MKKYIRFAMPAILLATMLVGFNDSDKYFQIAKNLDIFAAFYRELNTYYVDDLPPEKLMNKGIQAILEETDPYTDFIPEENLEDLKFMATGKYGGIGAATVTDSNWTSISDIYEGGPMHKAGVKAGDIIVRLEGQNAKGMSNEDVSKLLKGNAGSTLNITFRNPMTGVETAKSIQREEINVRPVSYYGLVENDVAYIKMIQFTENCALQVQEAFEKLKEQHKNLKGVVLDLRSNPGGLLDEAVSLSNIFIDKNKLIVTTKGKVKNWDREYKTTKTAIDMHVPLVVLTNHNSASASEIVAGAVQDLDRGLIVGQLSFGKGLVQTTRALPYNTKLKVTTAKYYTPSGRCIQAIDYSHRNSEGEVDYVPDSLRKTFYTAAGRAVKDGGGIEPDEKLKVTYLSPIAVALLRKQFIFNYATKYYYSHKEIETAGNFSLSDADFEDFLHYLEGKDYSYKTRSEESLESFKNTAKKEKYFDAVAKEFDQLQLKIKHDKKQDILKNKTEIKHLLEEEIVNRYYLSKGRIERSLAWDKEVLAAVDIFHTPNKYQQLLQTKK